MSSIQTANDRRHLQSKTQTRLTWGDPLISKNKECIRIMFQNINGFGHKKDDEIKTRGFMDLIKDLESDVFAMAETNIDWRLVPKKKTIWDQTQDWFENRSVVASYNLHDSHSQEALPFSQEMI